MDKRAARCHVVRMHLDLSTLLAAVGLALVFEGLPYFLSPKKMPELLRFLAELEPARLRFLGLTAMILGLALVFAARTWLAG